MSKRNLRPQIDIIKDMLDKGGYVTRNFALQNGITRLAGYIYKLKKQGYNIVSSPRNKRDGDYRYELIK